MFEMAKNKYRNWEIQIGEAVSVRKGGKPGSSSPARPTLSPAFPVWNGKDDKYMKYKYTKYKYRTSVELLRRIIVVCGNAKGLGIKKPLVRKNEL